MTYPSTSDFTSSTNGSAWYIDNGNSYTPSVTSSNPNVCSGDGNSLLISLLGQLGAEASAATLTSFDGSVVDPVALAAEQSQQFNGMTGYLQNGWDPVVLKALYAVAAKYGASSDFLTAIQSDAALGNGSVSVNTLRAGIWIGDRIYTGHGILPAGTTAGSPAQIAIPAGTITPPMDIAPPAPPGGANGFSSSFTCIATPAAVSLVPANQTVVPWVYNPWIWIAIAAGAAIFVTVMASNVPVLNKAVRARTTQPNPSRRRSRKKKRHVRG